MNSMAKVNSRNTDLIINYIKEYPKCSSNDILINAGIETSIATLKRHLQRLVSENIIIATGQLKGTKYEISPVYEIIESIDINEYFENEIDERKIKHGFNPDLMNIQLKNMEIFTKDEMLHLSALQAQYLHNVSTLSEMEFKKELERLAIDLCWKSSQIEGNTYSLLETERLLKDKETAAGKTKEEASMLLNHKEALDFIIANPDYLYPLNVSGIEDIHSLLIKELGINRNIRNNRVGISGTNYRPLDNEFQIREALNDMCILINIKENIFEKALLCLMLISYIQPFGDGNKRTARIVSNAILIHNHYCPVSFRTVDSIEYKKAMLIFYEQNNISAFKKMFIDQFEFAVKTYF